MERWQKACLLALTGIFTWLGPFRVAIVNAVNRDSVESYRAQILELSQIITSGIRIPTAGEAGVFATSYDWHSSVHAHWSLLTMARVTQNSELKNTILSRLSSQALREVQNQLRQDPSFEQPYGRAWLLLLTSELRKHRDLTVDRELQIQVAGDVIGWLERTAVTDGPNGYCSGGYDSWVLNYFLVNKSNLGSEWRSRLQRLQQKLRNNKCAHGLEGPSDFSRPAEVAQILLQEPAFTFLPPTLPLEMTIDLSNCHRLGQVVTTGWLLAATGAKGNEGARTQFKDFLNEYLLHGNLWRDDFVTSSHWIPQFLWMAIWLSLGEP